MVRVSSGWSKSWLKGDRLAVESKPAEQLGVAGDFQALIVGLLDD